MDGSPQLTAQETGFKPLLDDEINKWSEGNDDACDQVPYLPDEGVLATFSRWRGTILPYILDPMSSMMWPLVLFQLTLHYVNDYVLEDGLPPMDEAFLIGLPAALLIFLTVFYNSNCYSRFFELWGHTCDLIAVVNNWVLQTAFIFEELDVQDGNLDGKLFDIDLWDAMWTVTRRVLASMFMLFMQLDVGVEKEDKDWLGRPKRLPNIMHGDGLDESEYEVLVKKGLLTWNEVKFIKTYKGFKCQVPIKWALNEVRALCKPEDRMQNQARNYEAMQEIAANFNKTAVKMTALMQQPVPFVYFHVLKLMMLVVLGTIAYELVTLFEGMWVVSMFTFVVVAAMLLGLMEIANKMSDPFGTDDTDFDTHKLCDDAYRNAVAYLSTGYLKTLSEEHMSRASSFKAGKGKKKDMRKEVFDNLEIVQGNPLRVFHEKSAVFSSAGFAALSRRMSGKDLMSGVQLSHEDDVAA